MRSMENTPVMSIDFLFHPPLVHFPIAFYFLELVLLLFWAASKDAGYRRFALFSFRLGYLFMVAAAVAGLVDAGGWHKIQGPVRTHFLSAAAVFGLYTARALYWRFAKEEGGRTQLFLILSALLGNILVSLTGYFGGKLVFG